MIFVRLSKCNLNCSWCDTQYAKNDGTLFTIDDIVRTIAQYKCKFVEITGGEPLLQENTYTLIKLLLESGYTVLLETNGSVSIKKVPPGTIKIMDIKCPSSGMHPYTDWENLKYLNPFLDEIKFVLADRNDYEYAVNILQQYNLTKCCRTVLFSPIMERLSIQELTHWILQDALPVRLQIQLQRIIWGENHQGK